MRHIIQKTAPYRHRSSEIYRQALSLSLFVGWGSVCACTASYLFYPSRFSCCNRLYALICFRIGTIPLAFCRVSVCVCLVGFASIAIVVVCGRCVLHRLFATTCKHPCLKPLGTHAKASVPPYERSVGFASCKAFGRSCQASLPCLPLPLNRSILIFWVFLIC